MTGLTLVKFGGSVVTEKTAREQVRLEVLATLCREFAGATTGQCIIGHGSGSFGHRTALDHGIRDGVFPPSEMGAGGATRASALRLHQQVLDALNAAGVPAASLPPADWCAWEDDELSADLTPLRSALDRGVVPLVMGDVIQRSEGGARIASTEEIFVRLALDLPVRTAVWVGDTDGILDPDGSTLARLEASERLHFHDPGGADVTGGMSLRWRAVQTLARLGVESVLINGLREGELRAALGGGQVRGTRVVGA